MNTRGQQIIQPSSGQLGKKKERMTSSKADRFSHSGDGFTFEKPERPGWGHHGGNLSMWLVGIENDLMVQN